MSDVPVPPPPPSTPPEGTAYTKFLQSSGAKTAIVLTVVVFNMIWRPFVIVWGNTVLGDGKGEMLALGIEGAEMAWLAALGIQRSDSGSLRDIR
mgnify:FL=1